jgi:DNA-binding IclR family transcriptional regulator
VQIRLRTDEDKRFRHLFPSFCLFLRLFYFIFDTSALILGRQMIPKMDAPVSDEERIPTNLRALLILEALAAESGPITPTELGRRIGLPKQTIHRLCATLMEEGYLARGDSEKGLRPGRRARDIAMGILHDNADVVTRRQILKRISAEVQETVNFAAPTADGMTYVDRVETDWAFRIQLPIGAVVPFHCTASGKTYLASLPAARRRKLVHALTLEARSDNSKTDPEELLAELSEIASQGYAIDNEELMEGMVALSAPVLDHRGRFIAAIAFHGPTPRLTVDIALSHLETLKNASRDLTEALFATTDD